MRVEILTPERLVHSTEGDEVTIPTTSGVIGVRRGHLPLMTVLQPGEIVIKKNGAESEHIAVTGGFAEVLPESIRILSRSANLAEELQEEVVQEAVERAKAAKVTARSEGELHEAAAALAASLAQMRVVRRKKSRGRTRLGDSSEE